MEAYILDIGATKIECVVIKNETNMIYRFDCPNTNNFEMDMEILRKAFNPSENTNFLAISFPGLINQGVVRKWPNKLYWEGQHLISSLQAIFNTKCIIILEDSNAGALAALHIFEQKATSLFVNVGSGIGMGILIHGELYKGQSGSAGELGHTTVDYSSSDMCPCGRAGCLQLMASGKGMRSIYESKFQLADQEYWMESRGSISILETGARFLGKSIANVINILDITNIHLSGSVLKNSIYQHTLLGTIKHEEKLFLDRKLRVVISPNLNASLLGACAYAFEEYGISGDVKQQVYKKLMKDFK